MVSQVWNHVDQSKMWKQILIEMVVTARYFINSVSITMVAGHIGQVAVIN